MSKVLVVPKHLYPHQKDLIKTVLEDTEGKWYIVKSCRQLAGKTHCLENLILLVALTRPGSVSMVCEPSNAQSAKVASETYAAVSHLKGIRYNGSTNLLWFDNGSKVYFKSSEADPKSIRGYTIKRGGILVLDEGGFIPEEYYNAIFPIIRKYKAPLVVASTPDRQSGMFWNLWNRGLENDQSNVVSINWSKYVDTFYTPEELEFYKSVYSSRRFRTEILGEFSINSGTVFSNLSECLGKPKSESKEYYVGVDWGTGSGKDYTVITILNKDKEMVYLKAFNDIAPMEQVTFLKDLLWKYKPKRVLVEGNSIGSIYFDALERPFRTSGIKVQKFQTTNDSKCRIVDQLAAHLEQRKITLLDNEELLRELAGYEEQITKSGLRTYNCPPPLHDDYVMSLCIALEAATSNKGTYSISIY